jgi:predicted  nucleic acid-binding Zn-ribbon protein
VAKAVTHRDDEEKTLRQRIKQLKERERRIREERHHLESQLREKIFKRFREIEQRIE